MAKTDTNLSQLIINKLTGSQYYAAVKNENEIYATTDGNGLFLGTTNLTPIDNKTRTNCITEIPQDIKLEFNDGILTLKAGSKVYVPNGSGLFDVVNISTDLLRTPSTTDGKYLLFYNKNGFLNGQLLINCGSGNSVGSFSGYFYDTSNNKINWYVNGVNQGQGDMSLPLCIYNCSSNSITSIDQVFNGFGYIGSTVFALPGVKGLIPNGINADGSLKNIEFTTDHVSTVTNVSNLTMDLLYLIDANGNIVNSSTDYWEYDEEKNSWFHDSVSWGLNMPFARSYAKGGKVENFAPKTLFHALDYNDKSTISGWGMPSSRYIDLTLGTGGSSYTAPANGYFSVIKAADGDGQYFTFECLSSGITSTSWPEHAGNNARCFIPVKKGNKVSVFYTVGGSLNQFRFIYAEGEN